MNSSCWREFRLCNSKPPQSPVHSDFRQKNEAVPHRTWACLCKGFALRSYWQPAFGWFLEVSFPMTRSPRKKFPCSRSTALLQATLWKRGPKMRSDTAQSKGDLSCLFFQMLICFLSVSLISIKLPSSLGVNCLRCD